LAGTVHAAVTTAAMARTAPYQPMSGTG
jgi:hypothetical protein